MVLGLILIAAVVVLGVVVWFFGTHNPEQAARHDQRGGGSEQLTERSHFAPGNAGAEDQAVPRAGEPGPRDRVD